MEREKIPSCGKQSDGIVSVLPSLSCYGNMWSEKDPWHTFDYLAEMSKLWLPKNMVQPAICWTNARSESSDVRCHTRDW